MNHRPRVAIADDHPLAQYAIAGALAERPAIRVVGTAGNPDDLMTLLSSTPCDVVILDFVMPGGVHPDGIDLIQALHLQFPGLHIVMLTGLSSLTAITAIRKLGVNQIVSKADDLSTLPHAVYCAMEGRHYVSPALASRIKHTERSQGTLSSRERQILLMFAQGMKVNDIASALGRSKQAVSTHKHSGMRKLGICSDSEIYLFARELETSASGDPP